jgi:hypothetical protein
MPESKVFVSPPIQGHSTSSLLQMRKCSRTQRETWKFMVSSLTCLDYLAITIFSTLELFEGVYPRTGIPIVFDYHHHGFCTGGISEKDALEIAISTWGDIKPVVHYSESRAEEKKDPKIRAHAHSDYVNGPIDDYGYDLDVMIEAKAKELALFGLRKNDAARLTAAA